MKLARAEDLAARNLIPQSELEAAQVTLRSTEAQLRSSQAQMTQAEASLNQTQVNLEHTVITAPIDGIVISRAVDVGQTVSASMQAPTLFVLAADLTKMRVNASIDEADVGRIRPGQVVWFTVDAYPGEDFEGRVSQVRLEAVVVQNVVTYATVIDVQNPDLKLKPGMTATVTLEIARATMSSASPIRRFDFVRRRTRFSRSVCPSPTHCSVADRAAPARPNRHQGGVVTTVRRARRVAVEGVAASAAARETPSSDGNCKSGCRICPPRNAKR